MKLATAYFPHKKANTITVLLSVSLAICVTLLTVIQLIAVEKFIPFLEQHVSFLSATSLATLFAGSLSALGVGAIPFLLRMRVSPLLRICSAVSLNTFGVLWLGIATGGAQASQTLGSILLLASLLLIAFSAVVTWLLRDDLGLL